MTYSQVNSSAGHVGELGGTLFEGHSPDGVFSSLKGNMLTPMELSFSDQDGNIGPDRLNQEVAPVEWLQHGPVMSGTFDPQQIVRGTDKHMPK